MKKALFKNLILIIMLSVCLFMISVFNNGNTKQVSAEDTSYQYVNLLKRRTSKSDSDNEKTVMFIPESVAGLFGYQSLPEQIVIDTLPTGSAILRLKSSGKAYIKESLDTYVEVVERAAGFDYCSTGSINYGWSEYSCSYSGVQHYKGKAYDYYQIKFYHSAQVNLTKDGSAWIGQNVDLYKNGQFAYDLAEVGNGCYKNQFIYRGIYEIYVNGVRTNQSIDASSNDVVGGTYYNNSGEYYRSKNNFTKDLNYYDLTVNTFLDGEASTIGNVKLFDGSSYKEMTTSNGVSTISNILDNNGTTYEIIIDGKSTRKTVKTGQNPVLVENIDFYTLSLSLKEETALGENVLFDTATVSLRDGSGNDVGYLPYTSASGTTAIYSMIIQKDESDTPFEYHIFVNNRNTQEVIKAVNDYKSATATFYNAQINLIENGSAKYDSNVTVSSKDAGYSLLSTNGAYTFKALKDSTVYKVNVDGVIDDNNGTYTIDKDNRVLNLSYFRVDVKSYDWLDANDQVVQENGTHYALKTNNYRTYHVINNGCVPSIPDAYVSGLTFEGWSTTPWSLGSDNTKYDFSVEVTEPKTIYAQFVSTSVDINGYIRTSEDGTKNATGMYLRTPNLVISGFEKGDNSIKSVMISTVGFAQLKLLSTSVVKGSNSVSISATQGDNLALVDNTASEGIVVIVFNEKVSMAVAETYLRENVVYMPVVNGALSITVKVSDGVLSATGSQTIAQNPTSSSWLYVYAGVYGGTNNNLSNGTYWYGSSTNNYIYFSVNTTFNNASNTGHAGLEIRGNTVFYIPSGVTLTCIGSHGSGSTPGEPGIKLPENISLTVLGSGKIVATGGNAGAGSNGADGGGCYCNWNGSDMVHAFGGSGGAGGAGGGGAGAGIGTAGGAGGAGGAGNNNNNTDHFDQLTFYKNSYKDVWPRKGSPGSNGKTANAMGTLNTASTITIVATGGSASSTGGSRGGTASGENKTWGWYQVNSSLGINFVATSGAGGAGGGSGYGANGIGTGGAGGGGGGSGATGGVYYSFNYIRYFGAYSGGGGAGYVNGGGGGHQGHNDTQYRELNSSATGGKAGSGSVAKTANSISSPYSVYFMNGSTEVNKQTYLFESKNINVPEGVEVAGYAFLGWKLSTYGKNVTTATNAPLTSAENKLYQPGDTITLNQYTYGDITFKAVYIAITGKTAGDKLSIGNDVFVSGDVQPIQTLYTYTLNATLDGLPHDFGPIKIVNTLTSTSIYVLSNSKTVGTYSIELEENATYNVYVNGVAIKKVGQIQNVKAKLSSPKILTSGDDLLTLKQNEIETVNFVSLSINISGIDADSVKLVGDNAPLVTGSQNLDGSYTYTAYAQEGTDTTNYQVQVNETVVPLTSTTTAKFGGDPAIINFSDIKATINTNALSEIDSVELKSTTETITLVKDGDFWTANHISDYNITYNIYINGKETSVSTLLDSPTVEVTGDFYRIDIETKIDGTNADIDNVMFDTISATRVGEGVYKYYTLSKDLLTATISGAEVASITPSTTSSVTYINYYTITYSSSDSTGNAPVDNNVYLAGTDAIVLDKETLAPIDNTKYFGGWALNSTNYSTGDTYTINSKTVFVAIWKSDDLKVQYYDRGTLVKTVSEFESAEKITPTETLTSYIDATYKYTVKYWTFSVDGKNYEVNEATSFTAEDIIKDENIEFFENTTTKIVTFTAVYELEYRYDIHFIQGYDELASDDDQTKYLSAESDINKTFTVNYKVTVNDGVNSLVLLPEYDSDVFKVVSVTTNNNTCLGGATITLIDENTSQVKILFEGLDLYDSIGDMLFSIEYELINAVGGKFPLGLVLDYREVSTDSEKTNDNRSHSYVIGEQSTQTEVRIFVDNNAYIIVTKKGTVTVLENQEVVYDATSLSGKIGHQYVKASEFDEKTTYYYYSNESYIEETIELDEDLFSEKEYYILNSTDSVLFFYNGYAMNNDNMSSTYTYKWYSYENSTYTLLDSAPITVGDYYLGISATENEYYTASDESTKVKVTIIPYQLSLTLVASPSEKDYTGSNVVWTIGEISVSADNLTTDMKSTWTSLDDDSTPYTLVSVDAHSYSALGEYELTVNLSCNKNFKFTDDNTSQTGTGSVTVSIVIAANSITGDLTNITKVTGTNTYTKLFDNVTVWHDMVPAFGDLVIEYSVDGTNWVASTATWNNLVNDTTSGTTTTKGSIYNSGVYYVRWYVKNDVNGNYRGVNVDNRKTISNVANPNYDKWDGTYATLTISKRDFTPVTLDYSVDGVVSFSEITKVVKDSTTDVDIPTTITLTYSVGTTEYTPSSNKVSIDATSTGTYTITVTPSDTTNYNTYTITTLEVFKVEFKEGTHAKNTTDSGVEVITTVDNEEVITKVSGFETQYRFKGQNSTQPTKKVMVGETETTVNLDPEITGYTFFIWGVGAYTLGSAVTENVTLAASWTINNYTITYVVPGITTNQTKTFEYLDKFIDTNIKKTYTGTGEKIYTFNGWGYNELTPVTPVQHEDPADTTLYLALDTDTITKDLTVYAVYDYIWNKFGVKVIVNDEFGNQVKVYDNLYSEQTDKRVLVGGSLSSIKNEIDTYQWYKVDGLYSSYSSGTYSNIIETMYQPASGLDSKDTYITLYAYYKFNIGKGDVNGNGLVDAPYDVTIYRKWIVGGYSIIEINPMDEWETVYGDPSASPKVEATYDSTKQYFLRRVSDTSSDYKNDVRDVTTIRMALTGGYGYFVNERVNVTGQEISLDKYLNATGVEATDLSNFKNAMSYGTFYLNDDFTLNSNEQIVINADSNIYFNGHSINLSDKGFLITNKNDDIPTVIFNNADIVAENNAIKVNGGASFTLTGSANIESNNGNTFEVSGTGTTLTTTGTIKSTSASAILISGDMADEPVVNINMDSILSSSKSTVVMDANGTLNITGAEIVGATALYIKNGTVNISNAEKTVLGTQTAVITNLQGTGERLSYQLNSYVPTGDAIVLDSISTKEDIPEININDVIQITSSNGNKIAQYNQDGKTKPTYNIETGNNIEVTEYSLVNTLTVTDNTVTLTGNTVLDTESFVFTSGTTEPISYTVDLGGYNLMLPNRGLMAGEKTELTIKNGTINASLWGVWARDGANVTVESNASIVSSSTDISRPAFVAIGDGTNVTIKGSISANKFAIYADNKSNVTIESTAVISSKETAIQATASAVVTIEAGAQVISTESIADNLPTIAVYTGAKVEVSGTVSAISSAAISSNGSADESAIIIIHDGASISSQMDLGIYMPSAGTLTIDGGAISGTTAIYIKSGTTTIENATITATGEATSYTKWNNGAHSTGAALVIDSMGYPGGAPVVTIKTGNTFQSAGSNKIEVYNHASVTAATVTNNDEVLTVNNFNVDANGVATEVAIEPQN